MKKILPAIEKTILFGGIILNEDPSNYFMLRSDAENLTGFSKLAEHYCRGGVKEIFYCVGAARVIYDSKVMEPLWTDVTKAADGTLLYRGKPVTSENTYRWIKHVMEFHEKGIDPVAVFTSEIRKRGVSPWLSIRVNDCHGTPDIDAQHSRFWREHPEMWLVNWRPCGPWADRALNFAFPEVQQQLLDFVAELLERYDTDGIELDWMRFGYHFRYGEEANGRAILTDLHRKIRAMADKAAEKRKHPVKIAARVPAHPEIAWNLGYDPVTWCREKLIDVLTPCPFFVSTDLTIPVALWRQMVGKEVILAPGVEVGMRIRNEAHGISDITASAMAHASVFFEQGADRIYLFNYFDRFGYCKDNPDLPAVLENAGNLETAAKERRRHVVTYIDTQPAGQAMKGVLPHDLYPKDAATFRIPIGKAPDKSRNSRAVIGLTEESSGNFRAFLNGIPVKKTEVPPMKKTPHLVKQLLAFKVSDAIKDGDNVLDIINDTGKMYQIRWCEIWIDK